MLMWEDGFCRTRAAECMEGTDVEDPVRKAFSKMSIQLYNYGEGWLPSEWTDQFASGIQAIPSCSCFPLPHPHGTFWDHSSIHSASPITTPSVYQPPTHGGLPNDEDGTHLFLPRSSGAHLDDATRQHETDLRWPNGLSLFTALTGRADDAKLLFGSEELGNELPPRQLPLLIPGKNPASKSAMTRYSNADETKAVPDAILGEDDTGGFLS
ncbi:hypothetical protein B296_00056918 [Ensete ventricosum]|uniref:Transcription factor MYC/MYB N-terminal domain-containing protein n=1 Tax=Ensete ventricosum TaxID=4639 RepID=A0A426X2S2_ENSVE|nr:hypothetical protein B296_00056918 [Ensete ventricosum]